MDLSRPAASVVPSLDVEVLIALAGTTRPLTGRDISRLVRRGSWSGVRRVLSRLVDHGLVEIHEAGPALLYLLNRDHVAAPAVLALADLRTELFQRIRTQITAWPIPPVLAAVFGSAARGDGDLDSDVDVFLVRPADLDADDPEWRRQISELSAGITRWTGNPASTIEASPREVQAMVERDEPVIADLTRDAVPLTDESIADIFSSGGSHEST